MVTTEILPFKENSHGRTGDPTRDLMISSQRLWPLDHEAGHLRKNQSWRIQLTSSVEQYIAWESNKCCITQEIFRVLWTPNYLLPCSKGLAPCSYPGPSLICHRISFISVLNWYFVSPSIFQVAFVLISTRFQTFIKEWDLTLSKIK